MDALREQWRKQGKGVVVRVETTNPQHSLEMPCCYVRVDPDTNSLMLHGANDLVLYTVVDGDWVGFSATREVKPE